jgi:hypothetical protein
LSGTLDARDLADLPRADRLAGALGVFAGPRLRADLHDPLESPGHVGHPAPFADEQVQRLLDVHVLAGRAAHHGHQGVPVVRRRDDQCVHVLAIEQLAEIAVLCDRPADRCRRRCEPRLVHVRHSHDLRVRLSHHVPGMHLADQPVADQSHADPFVGPVNPAIPHGRQGRRRPALQESTTGEWGSGALRLPTVLWHFKSPVLVTVLT